MYLLMVYFPLLSFTKFRAGVLFGLIMMIMLTSLSLCEKLSVAYLQTMGRHTAVVHLLCTFPPVSRLSNFYQRR